MKFIYHIMLRVALSLSVVLGVWAILFYCLIVDEVNDETDDVLEDYAAMIIQNFLAGEEMPTNDNGSNNTYYLRAINPDSVTLAKQEEGFFNADIYIKYKRENEPARVLKQVFMDRGNHHYEVTVITPTIDNNDLIDAIWQSMLILFILLLIVMLVINTWAIKSGLHPLDRFLSWLNNSDIETCELPTTEKSHIREIVELSNAIQTFAGRGRRAFEEQKEFIGNASHELQTPIAICQNRLELLCESGLTQEQLEDVAGCLSTLSRLSKLNKSLLMLSKIENGGFENSQVSINNLVHRNIEQLEDLYLYRNISLTLKELGSCLVEINNDLAATLVVNLIKNSYTHNIDGGRIEIEIGRDLFKISNTGAEIALDSQKIFSRFYQSKAKSGTYGLGLPITLSICKLYQFKIDYYFTNQLHCFEIKFK